MALFQNSVLKKYLNELDNNRIAKLYTHYSEYFLNPDIQQNIRESKEEQFQEGFLRELFVKVLGYTINPNPNYNLTTELKNESGAKKADGAIMKNGKAIGVIELKSTTTKDLESIRQQAFDYKANHSECIYVVTSNFEKLRFYIDNAVDFEEFDLFTLTLSQFKLLYLCLNVDNILGGVPKSAKKASLVKEENVTKKLYADYSVFKEKLFKDIISKSENIELAKEICNKGLQPLVEDEAIEKQPLVDRDEKEAKLILFKKTQKLMDRFLFIFFSEDRGLIPPNTISTILTEWEKLKALDAYRPLYDRFKRHFNYINEGWKGDNYEVFAYNGGLFLPDPILDSITIDDEVLYEHTKVLTKYDFESEVDVNILGHIFEHSLTEIETVSAELEGQEIDKKKTKRKKDGVFYTPKYITKYIVDNTVGKLCEEKKQELGIEEEEYLKGKKNRRKETVKKLEELLITYRDWLLGVTIVDPACGSGAFLNQALEFLIAEHRWIDEMTAKLFGGGLVFQDVENSILENNLYGVDINEESVEIAKLSLWLRTAQKGRKLTSLNNNIKCGNSLIDDPTVAGDKALKWEEEFPKVFPEKEKKAFHVTWVTHNSRTSQRMVDYNAKKGDGVWLTEEMEVQITKSIIKIVEEDELNVMAYNICGDHVHILLVCEEEELPNIVRKLKGKSSQELKTRLEVRKEDKFKLWAQKYSKTYIDDGDKLNNTIEYIINNREKHNLPSNKELLEICNKGLQKIGNKGLQPLVEDGENVHSNKELQKISNKELQKISNKGLQPLVEDEAIEKHPHVDSDDDNVSTHPLFRSQSYAFRTERKGGFDVVIGNPPYVDIKGLPSEITRYLFKAFTTTQNRINLYSVFVEKGYNLLKEKGFFSFIIPNSILVNSSYSSIREMIIDDLYTIIKLPDNVFRDAKVETIILSLRKIHNNRYANLIVYNRHDIISQISHNRLKKADKKVWKDYKNFNFNIHVDIEKIGLLNKLKQNSKPLKEIAEFSLGITPYDKYVGHTKELIKNRGFHSETKLNESYKPLISGSNITRHYVDSTISEYIKYGDWLGSMREEKFFTQNRVIVRQIVSGNPPRIYAGYTDKPLFFTQIGFSIIPVENSVSVYTLTGIINSKLINFYHTYMFLDLEKELFQKILIANCKEFPINNNAEKGQIEIEQKVKDMVIMKHELYSSISTSFLNLIQSKFDIDKLSKKLQSWHELDFKQFLAELKKKKVKLSLSEEAEWMDYFNEKKAEAQELKAKIDATDNEIDHLVYKLYDLTYDEVLIVDPDTPITREGY